MTHSLMRYYSQLAAIKNPKAMIHLTGVSFVEKTFMLITPMQYHFLMCDVGDEEGGQG